MIGMDEKIIVVKTKLNPRLSIEAEKIILRNYWTFRWCIKPIAIVMFCFSALMFATALQDSERIVAGIMFLAVGLIPLSLFYLPATFFGTCRIKIKPHEIILTFYDDRLNVNVIGGGKGEWCLEDIGTSKIRFAIDLDHYGSKDWKYDDIKANVTKDYFYLSRGRFITGAVFKKSHIVYGGPDQLKRLLKEKLCERYIVGKDALNS